MRIPFGPVTNGLGNSPTGSKDRLQRGPRHHTSDRQYRSHAYRRARSAMSFSGLSLPNRIPGSHWQRGHLALLTSSITQEKVAMPQAIQIEAQSEQKSLAHLGAQRSTRGTSRELSFDRGKYALDQCAASIDSLRKGPPHFGTHAAQAPSFLSAFGRDHALRSKFLPNVGVISLAVELGVGQHQADGCLLRSRFDDRGQIRTVVPGTAPRDLRQQELLIQIRHHHPLQPVPPRQRLLPMMMHPAHKKRAHRPLRQTRGVHRDARPLPSSAQRTAQPAYCFPNGTVDGLIVEALQETVQRREIGHTDKPKALTQFAMFAEPHLGLAKGPVFVAHQAKNGQQLRLRELVFAEAAAVAR